MARKISVTEALNELKLYDDKINKAIDTANFIGTAKKSSDKMAGGVSKEEFNKRAKSDLQSVEDKIVNRNKLKSAIVKSNAETLIDVADKQMTRADGIERKTSIKYDEALLYVLKQQYKNALDVVAKENKKVDSKVDDLLSTLAGRNSSETLKKEESDVVEKSYRENNEYGLVDPCKLYDKIQKLETDINAFKANIDTALTISNATSFIELDF